MSHDDSQAEEDNLPSLMTIQTERIASITAATITIKRSDDSSQLSKNNSRKMPCNNNTSRHQPYTKASTRSFTRIKEEVRNACNRILNSDQQPAMTGPVDKLMQQLEELLKQADHDLHNTTIYSYYHLGRQIFLETAQGTPPAALKQQLNCSDHQWRTSNKIYATFRDHEEVIPKLQNTTVLDIRNLTIKQTEELHNL